MVQTRLSIRKCHRVYKFESLPYDVPLRPRKPTTRKIRKLPVPFVPAPKIVVANPEKEIEIMDLTKDEMEIENEEMSDRVMETASDEELPMLQIIMQPKPEIPKPDLSPFKLPKLEKVHNFEISNSSLNSTIDLGRPKKRRIDRTLLRTGGIRRTSYNLVSPSDASDDDSSDIDDSSSHSDEDDYEMNRNDLYL